MSSVLVAYFSASGNTADIAVRMADILNADLFKIEPEQPYTKADLDWDDELSRSSVEMKDRSSRPGISGKIYDISIYDTIFIGFPIWWFREPSIIDTFMESYAFDGIKVVPFATSGTSGMGEAADNIQDLAPGAQVVEGKRFPPKVSEEDLRTWIDTVL